MIQSLDIYKAFVDRLVKMTSPTQLPSSLRIESWLNQGLNLLWLKMYPKLDRDEEGRKFFSEYIKSYKTLAFGVPAVPLSSNSYYIDLPSEAIKILQEQCYITNVQPPRTIVNPEDIEEPNPGNDVDGFPPTNNASIIPINSTVIIENQGTTVQGSASALVKVKPITYDEYNINKDNPFKNPFFNGVDGLVWRVDTYGYHELILQKNTYPVYYQCVYLATFNRINLLNNSIIKIPAEYLPLIVFHTLQYIMDTGVLNNTDEQQEQNTQQENKPTQVDQQTQTTNKAQNNEQKEQPKD
jgi:hypothetical protein